MSQRWARRLQVSRATVHAWKKRLETGRLEALKRGARALEYATELWTLPRIGRLIESLFGIRYSDSQVWRILKAIG